MLNSAMEKEIFEIFLEECQDWLTSWEENCIGLENASRDQYHTLFRAVHSMKGSAAVAQLPEMASFLHEVEDLIMRMRDNKIVYNHKIGQLLLTIQSMLVDWVMVLHEDPYYIIDTLSLCAQLKTFQNPQLNPESATNLAADKTTVRTQDDLDHDLTSNTDSLIDESLNANDTAESPAGASFQIAQSIRIKTGVIDELMRSIDQLSISIGIVHTKKSAYCEDDSEFSRQLSQIYKGTNILVDQIMSLGLQPLTRLFRLVERVAIDVANLQKKKIRITKYGEGVEIDKLISESIKDPLVHIIRNAVDHGIESEEQRIADNKDAVATISISARKKAHDIEIVISDDGRGLHKPSIVKKALERGLIATNEDLSDNDIFNLIMAPGFSTKTDVSEISGRGVGMDVVKSTIDQLGGQLQINSTPGIGSTFTLSMPANASVVESLVVVVNERIYAVPFKEVIEVVDLNITENIQKTENGDVIQFRDFFVQIEKLANYLDTSHQANDHQESYNYSILKKKCRIALVVEVEEERWVGFEIDDIIDHQSLIVRSLTGSLRNDKSYSGSAILANGTPSMVLNLSEIGGLFRSSFITGGTHVA